MPPRAHRFLRQCIYVYVYVYVYIQRKSQTDYIYISQCLFILIYIYISVSVYFSVFQVVGLLLYCIYFCMNETIRILVPVCGTLNNNDWMNKKLYLKQDI